MTQPVRVRGVVLATLSALILAPAVVQCAQGRASGPVLGFGGQSSQWVRGKSLGEVAAYIKLRNPSGEPTGEIVVSDSNLKLVADLGQVSAGSRSQRTELGVVDGRSTTGTTRLGAAEDTPPDVRDEYREKKQRVAELEQDLAEYDRWKQDRRNPYARRVAGTGGSDPERARKEQELADARREAEDTRHRARREGIYLR